MEKTNIEKMKQEALKIAMEANVIAGELLDTGYRPQNTFQLLHDSIDRAQEYFVRERFKKQILRPKSA